MRIVDYGVIAPEHTESWTLGSVQIYITSWMQMEQNEFVLAECTICRFWGYTGFICCGEK